MNRIEGLLLIFMALVSATVGAQPPISIPKNQATALAYRWATSRDEPRCQTRGRMGELLGGPDARYCVWGATARSSLGAIIEPAIGLALVTWDREAVDAKDAVRITDSLTNGFARAKLLRRTCASFDTPSGRSSGFQWKGDSLQVQFIRVDPKSGPPHLAVLATNMPKPLPTIVCPPVGGGS